MLIEIIKKKITFLWLIIFVSFAIWISSFLTIPKENSPAVNIPMFIVNTISYGQSPETVEKNITNKLEDEIKSISWIKKIESVSNFNFSAVVATFNDNKNVEEAKLELKDAIDKASPNFPKNTITPIIIHANPDDTPIYSFWISALATSSEIYNSAKSLENNLKWITWISEIVVIWKPNKKISVYIDYDKMNQFWLNVDQVSKLLWWIFINKPVDKKAIWKDLYSYEITTFSKNIEKLLEQIKNSDLLNSNWKSIKVRDIAKVYYEEISERESSFIWKSEKFYNTVSFDVKSTPWSDVETVIKSVQKQINSWKAKNPKFKTFETFSKLVGINNVYGTFVSNFRQTWVTILIILFLFIWMRISLWVTITFPLVYFITFILLKLSGYTFNSIVSFALVLTLWIMVDNLIVITEWIIEQFKLNKWIKFWDATKNAVNKYMWSIIPWTLITVFMFVPISFMLSWPIGQFMFPLGITISFTLITSLVVSIILLPVILSKILPKDVKWSDWILTKTLNNVWKFLSKISWLLIKNKFTSLLSMIMFWGVLVFSFFLISIWFIKTDFMPQTDKDNIFINIKYPTWYTLEKNKETTGLILKDLNKYLDKNYKQYIDYSYINIWNIYTTSATAKASNTTSNYQSYINIKLIPWDDRDIASYKISENLSSYITKVIKKKYSFLKDISVLWWISMSGWKEVWFFIVWDDIKKISDYLNKIKPQIEKIPWAYNVSTNYEFTNWKITYYIDTNKVSRNKVPLSALIKLFTSIENSSYVPNGLAVYNFTSLWDDSIPLKIYTKYNWSVEDLKIWANFVSNVTEKRDLEPELKSISHIDWHIQLSIEADKKASVPLGSITAKINKIIETNPLPKWLKFRYNAWIEDSSKASKDLGTALGFWVLLMFFILVLKFNSIKYAVIILTSNILSFIWVVLALWLAWLPLSFPAQLWLFWVIWVWVNNAILFIDWFHNKQIKDLREKLLDTVKSRFTPIFLTSSTTIAWLVTLALKDELWWWLAIAFIGWLIINVLIVLFYLPALLYLTEKKEK